MTTYWADALELIGQAGSSTDYQDIPFGNRIAIKSGVLWIDRGDYYGKLTTEHRLAIATHFWWRFHGGVMQQAILINREVDSQVLSSLVNALPKDWLSIPVPGAVLDSWRDPIRTLMILRPLRKAASLTAEHIKGGEVYAWHRDLVMAEYLLVSKARNESSAVAEETYKLEAKLP